AAVEEGDVVAEGAKRRAVAEKRESRAARLRVRPDGRAILVDRAGGEPNPAEAHLPVGLVADSVGHGAERVAHGLNLRRRGRIAEVDLKVERAGVGVNHSVAGVQRNGCEEKDENEKTAEPKTHLG